MHLLPILISFWQNTDYLLHQCWQGAIWCAALHFLSQQTTLSNSLSLHTCCAQCCARGPCTWAQGVWWMQSGSLQREAPGSANTTHWLMKISGQMTASLKQPWEQLLLRIKWVIPPFSLIVSLRVHCAGHGCKYSFLFFFLNRKNYKLNHSHHPAQVSSCPRANSWSMTLQLPSVSFQLSFQRVKQQLEFCKRHWVTSRRKNQ